MVELFKCLVNLKLAFKLSILGFGLSILRWIIYWFPLLLEATGYAYPVTRPIIVPIIRYHYIISQNFLIPILIISTWFIIISSIIICLISLRQGWKGRLGYYTLVIDIASFIIITHNVVGGLLELLAFFRR